MSTAVGHAPPGRGRFFSSVSFKACTRRAIPAQGSWPIIAALFLHTFLGLCDDRAGAAGTALAQPAGARRPAAGGLGAGRPRRVRRGRPRQLLPEPARSSRALYTGLIAQDVSRIGAALKEAGIAFDVNSQGTAVLVRYGQTAQARMLLAEKGLPSSASAGYELFDKLGSMGLTSFMQEITRVRALEGEIARTIQAMKGVKAARVHIVLADTGSFRRSRQSPPPP